MYKITRTLLDGTSPSVLTNIPDNIRNKFISGPVYGKIKVIDTNEVFTQDDYLKDFKVSDLRFIPDQGIFGGAVAKELKINFVNVDKEFTLQDKEVEAYNSVIDEDEGYIYEIKYGRFIVQHPETEDTTDNTSITALDYMVKANEPYVNTITYPCTLRQLAENICGQLGLTLASESFRNQSFSVVDNQFVGGESYRNVIQNIAKSAFSWARIDENNELHFDFNKINISNIELDTDNYYKLSTDDLVYGPVNRIVIANSQIEGEATKIEDAQSITQNGLTEIVIYDNYFAYTQAKREQLITAAQNLLGLTYMPVNNIDLSGFCFLNCNDKLNITTLDENDYDTYLFDHIIEYNGTLKDSVQTKALTKTETKYAYTPEMTAALQKTEIIVDKQNQTITSTIERVDEQDNKISSLTQTVDELSSKISDVADVTVHAESANATVTLENINASEPINVIIHPLNQNISYLYPNTGLFPSDNTFLKIRTLRFIRTYQEDEGGQTVTKTENIDYELPDDLLFYDQDNYDEFYLSYDTQTCQITKKCKYNADGTVGLLDNEVIQTYSYPLIDLGDGDYTVTLLTYQYAYIFVRLMAANIYTTQFATKVELSSAITQTKSEINLSVNESLSNYSTTNEMNAAIDLTADSITSSVSQTYITKSDSSANISNAKQEAINSANNSTDTKLQNYSTTTQMNTTIQQATDNITLSVSATYETKSDSNTKINNLKSETIKNVDVEYALGTSTTTAPTSGWSTTAPQWENNKYMWQRTVSTYGDNTTEISDPTCIAGAIGKGVSSIAEYYALSTSNSTAPADNAFSTSVPTMTETNKYLWNYELVTYTDNSTQKTSKRVIGTYGNKGNTGVGIQSIQNKYAISTSNTTAPSSWSNTPPTMTEINKYLWNYEIITYTDSSTYNSTPTVIGTYGDTGIGVQAIVEQYYLSTSNTTQTGGSWKDTQDNWQEGKYIWTRSKITWTNNNVTYTQPILATGINNANETANYVEGQLALKVGKNENNQIVSMLNASANEINISGNRFVLDSDNFSVSAEGNITATGGTIGGFGLTARNFAGNLSGLYNYNNYDVRATMCRIMSFIGYNTILDNIFDANNDGIIRATDLQTIKNIINGTTENTKNISGDFLINTSDPKNCLIIEKDGDIAVSLGLGGVSTNLLNAENIMCGYATSNTFEGITINGENPLLAMIKNNSEVAYIDENGNIRCVSLTQTSSEEEKKNFEKLKNGLDIIQNTEIYKYNMKFENDEDKKHIGFIIGNEFNYRKEITSKDNDGVDVYSMVSVAYKAIQEQQEQIKELQEKDKQKDKIIADLIKRIETLKKEEV